MDRTLLWVVLILSGCSGILSRRSFIDEMGRDSDPFFRAGEDFPIVAGDTGRAHLDREEIMRRTPTPGGNWPELLLREDVVSKEASLSGGEYAHYKRARGYFENDSEKLYYLSLSPEERQWYLHHKEMKRNHRHGQNLRQYSRRRAIRPGRMPAQVAEEGPLEALNAVYVREEIRLGMSRDEVKNLWGMPQNIEVAGSRAQGNERWVFYRNGQLSYIYFEGGLVGGWGLQ